MGNIGGVKFWQIAVDEANGEEYFGESDDRSSVLSLYLQVLVGKLLANCASLTKFAKISLSDIFPCTSVPICLQEYLLSVELCKAAHRQEILLR